MIDVGVDSDGRIGVAFMDNHNQFAVDETVGGQQGVPFVLFSKLLRGPSLFAQAPSVRRGSIAGSHPAAVGDAVWPNTATGTELPSLDVRGARLSLDGQGNLVGRSVLRAGSLPQMASALRPFTSSIPTHNP